MWLWYWIFIFNDSNKLRELVPTSAIRLYVAKCVIKIVEDYRERKNGSRKFRSNIWSSNEHKNCYYMDGNRTKNLTKSHFIAADLLHFAPPPFQKKYLWCTHLELLVSSTISARYYRTQSLRQRPSPWPASLSQQYRCHAWTAGLPALRMPNWT